MSDSNNNSSLSNNSVNNNNNNLRLQLSAFRSTQEVNPELSDIIEIDRLLYTHWAIYVGDGYVVHVAGEDDQDLPDSQEAVVKRALLTDVVGDSCCRVNNKEVPAKERCLIALDPELVVKEANSRVRQKRFD